jgi:hypothetical protein
MKKRKWQLYKTLKNALEKGINCRIMKPVTNRKNGWYKCERCKCHFFGYSALVHSNTAIFEKE